MAQNSFTQPDPFLLRVLRSLDVVIAGVALVLLAPLLLLVLILARWQIGSPVFFRQRRAGRNNVPFEIIKFRTMRNLLGDDGQPLPDEQRLTGFGTLLRKTSLDELPELINVLRGEMSLVGPRPLFVEYLPYYTDRERLRLSVPPGLTGLAQISGRNYLGWDRKLELDAWFVEHLSLWLYLKILLMTPVKLLKTGDVSANPYMAEQPLNVERARAQGAPDV
jgi:lipopolysaccharide/colanic/teichoic acid biosynthesis glycosyltransferase